MIAARLYPSAAPADRAQDQDLVWQNPLCQEISREALENLLDIGAFRTYGKGDVLFRQGETPSHLHMLLQGRVSVSAERADGESTIIDMLPAGSLLLLTAGLLDLPYLVTVRATTDIRVMSLPVADFNEALKEHNSLALATLRHLAIQTRLLINQTRQLKLQTANERLAHYLLARIERTSGSAILELEEERRIIAQRLGMTPESLSRAIVSLREVGVTFEQRTVRVNDIALLHNYCGLEIMS